MEVKFSHSSTGITCVKSHAYLVALLVQHGLCAGERVSAAGLTRAAAVKARAAVGRSLHLWGATSVRGWHSTTCALLSWPMPPFTSLHSLRKSRLGAPGWLALSTAAAYNRSINTDAQVRPCALRTRLVCAGYLQRYPSLCGTLDATYE
jgi:hypothetical protein